MGKNKKISLFLVSGCLTPEAIRLFNENKITGENLKKIRRHLEKCLLCKEAVEGFKLMPDFKEQEESVQDIRKGLFRLLNKEREFFPGEMKIRRVYKYVAAAASVIFIVGMFSIYFFLLRQDNNMIADNIEAAKAVPETISEKQLQPSREKELIALAKKGNADEKEHDNLDQHPKGIGKGSEVDTKKSELVTIDKQEEIEEQEVLAETVKSEFKEKISGQVSAIQINNKEGDDMDKEAALTDEVQVYEISGVEEPEETKHKKSVVAGVAVQPEAAVFEKQGLPEVSGGKEETEPQPQFIVEGYKDFNDYIRKNVKYPETALTRGIGGNVKVEFFVNKKGKVIKVSVVEGIDETLNNEAIRVVSLSPRWIAAELNGKRINRKMTVTVEFYIK